MHFLKYLLIISFIFTCGQDEPKFIRKNIDNGDIQIKWYYYSYITNQSPDFITVQQKGRLKEIYKATWAVIDVDLKGQEIKIRVVEPSKQLIFTQSVDKTVFGYKILLDTTGTYEELMKVPDGVKEKQSWLQ